MEDQGRIAGKVGAGIGGFKTAHAVIALAILAILPYYGIIMNGFVWEDYQYIIHNTAIQDIEILDDVFFSDDAVGTGSNNPYYRPITTASFALSYQLWGDNPIGYHIVNLALHASTTLLLFLVLKYFFSLSVAFLAALFFSFHPANVEPVAYIVARADLLCGLFLTASFLMFLKADRSGKAFSSVASWAFFTLAVFSKCVALMFPAALATYLWLFDDKRGMARKLLPYVTISVAYYAARSMVLICENWDMKPLLTRISTSATLFSRYIVNAVFPFWLKPMYDVPIYNQLWHVEVIASFIFIILVGTVGFIYRKKNPKAIFGAIWFAISIFPVIGIIAILYPYPMADRYMYIPLIGASIFVGSFIERIGNTRVGTLKRGTLALIVVLPLVALSTGAMRRTANWSSDDNLYRRAAKSNPSSRGIALKYANILLEAGRFDEAYRVIKKFPYEKMTPKEAAALDAAFAMGYLKAGNVESAERSILSAIQTSPGTGKYIYYLSLVMREKGDLPLALYAAELAYKEYPNNKLCLENYNYLIDMAK